MLADDGDRVVKKLRQPHDSARVDQHWQRFDLLRSALHVDSTRHPGWARRGEWAL